MPVQTDNFILLLLENKQWSSSIASGGTWTYPIAFSVLYVVAHSFLSTSSGEKCLFKEAAPSSISNTTFKMNSNTSSIKSSAIAVGI